MSDNLLEQYERLQLSGSPDVFSFLSSQKQVSAQEQLAVLLRDQRNRWQDGNPLLVEEYLAQLPELASDAQIKIELAIGEYQARQDGDTAPRVEEFTRRFPMVAEELRRRIQQLEESGVVTPPGISTETMIPERLMTELLVGRYRIIRLLGQGAFGQVYLAIDADLQRQVAVKIPTPERFQKSQDAELYLAEARTVASLNHPHIVPVYDTGRTPQGAVFVVSRFIEGGTLEERLKSTPPGLDQAIRWLKTIAEALHYAHCRRLIHRDVKPANILIEDTINTPHLADFGLAMREEEYVRQVGMAGTPAYMSPEQARGEGHRLDGRSDEFSLGVILYEILTGQRPFRGSTPNEILHQVVSVEPSLPRSIRHDVPAELERICLKAISKRASDRYPSLAEMTEDLQAWLNPKPSPAVRQNVEVQVVPKGLRSFDASDAGFFLDLLPGPRNREGLPESLAFWKHRIEQTNLEQTFSVGLIYGPSGCGKSSLVKAGLIPYLSGEIVVVYVEATTEDTETRILRSLRKRLPELFREGEAPAEPPSNGPGAKIGSAGPSPSEDSEKSTLAETLSALRRRHSRKVLIIIDQFEQWLHAHRPESDQSLVQALRHCDGSHLQAIVLVRDDFWLAVSRFMQAVEVPIIEGQNSRLVDLFDSRHAFKVLTAFGRALGTLPLQNLDTNQSVFLTRSIDGLQDEGKIISVRLALFADMVKGRPWVPETLKEIGGTEGVGVAFLDETFASSTAPPLHRVHQQAAQSVLRALMPDRGTDIKGHMRSHAELMQACGYQDRPTDFLELLRILDGELRLITPTDPRGDSLSDSSHPSQFASRYYQLTHDYLVPALRDWLTRKQKETRRGRAQLKLAERSAMWNARQENRQLPSLLLWLQFCWLTRKTNWSQQERVYMNRARTYHTRRGILLTLLLLVAAVTGVMIREQMILRQQESDAANLVRLVLASDMPEVPKRIEELATYRKWADPLLREALATSSDNTREKRNASLALLPVDAGQVDYLVNQLLNSSAEEAVVLCDSLALHKTEVLNKLQFIVFDPLLPQFSHTTFGERPAVFKEGKESQILPFALTFARYDMDGERWNSLNQKMQLSRFVAFVLLTEEDKSMKEWIEVFRPFKVKLLAALTEVFGQHEPLEATLRHRANHLTADYAADKPELLCELLMSSDDEQFAAIFSKLEEKPERYLPELESSLDRALPLHATEADREKIAKRNANAAAALLMIGHAEKVWPMLVHRADPRTRSYLISRLSQSEDAYQSIGQRLQEEPDSTARRAMLLSFWNFPDRKNGSLEPDERTWFGINAIHLVHAFGHNTTFYPRVMALTDPPDPEFDADNEFGRRFGDEKIWMLRRVRELYRNDNDAGLHSAAEWLLRNWGIERLAGVSDLSSSNDEQTAKQRLSKILASLDENVSQWPQWYIAALGHTMIAVPGDVQFLMGSPEVSGLDDEPQHRHRIDRAFAIANKVVTMEQFREFDPGYSVGNGDSRVAELPVGGVRWNQALSYCNWLSGQEGIPEDQWCYLIQGDHVQLKPNWLSLTGYRLPTGAEMEYTSRAGAETSRFYGETDELLSEYAWFDGNSEQRARPVGRLKPNDFGLFDVYGNVSVWCHDRTDPHEYQEGEVINDDEAWLTVSGPNRIARGGSFYDPASNLRSAKRFIMNSLDPASVAGIRVARTLPPDLSTALPSSEDDNESR